ncbi:uncharacterized protein METZ01_LOCUS381870, partial [marine metagenome]
MPLSESRRCYEVSCAIEAAVEGVI